MSDIRLENLREDVRKRFKPFLEDIVEHHGGNIHSVHVTGSSLTEDYDPGTSDTNSVVVLREMDLAFLEILAPRGKKYGKMKVAAPLIMTPAYIEGSLDVFPIEFLDIKLIHETVYGDDVFKDIRIDRKDLRHQCEREVKSKLIGLRQGYISSAGDARAVLDAFTGAISGYMSLFRGIIFLCGKEPPVPRKDVLGMVAELSGVDCGVFGRALREKRHREKLGVEEVNRIFEEYYWSTEKLGRFVDEIAL